jgi:hypothetical protein
LPPSFYIAFSVAIHWALYKHWTHSGRKLPSRSLPIATPCASCSCSWFHSRIIISLPPWMPCQNCLVMFEQMSFPYEYFQRLFSDRLTGNGESLAPKPSPDYWRPFLWHVSRQVCKISWENKGPFTLVTRCDFLLLKDVNE